MRQHRHQAPPSVGSLRFSGVTALARSAPPLALALALVLALLLVAACSTGSRSAAQRVALVIGNAAYENATPLANPGNDASDMCAALKAVGFRTLCHTNVRDREEFDLRVQEYIAQLDERTVGVFYYSGHGVQAGNANYLIPTQVQPRSASEDPTRVLYGVHELFARLRQQATGFQLVILDACRTDLFGQRAGPAGRALPARSALIRSLDTVARASNGLQPILDAPSDTIVLYATASRDTAFDGEGRNGPLTQHILKHIGTRGVFVEEFIKRVTQGVISDTSKSYGKRQTPFNYGSFSGRFCFAGCPGENTPSVLTGL